MLLGCSSTQTDARLTNDDLTVSVLQARADVVSRTLQVRIENRTDETVGITSVEVDSGQFDDTAVWKKDSTSIRPGGITDLPVAIPPADCADPDPEITVRLVYEVEGQETAVAVTPIDERNRLRDLRTEDCFALEVEAVAGLAALTDPRPVSIGAVNAIELDLAVTPAADGTGGGGAVAIDSVAGTTLFSPLDPATGETVPVLPLDRVVRSEDDRSKLTLTLVPNRCDPHAVAEDKRGTIFPLRVTAPDGTTDELYITAPPAIRAALIALLQDVCAMG